MERKDQIPGLSEAPLPGILPPVQPMPRAGAKAGSRPKPPHFTDHRERLRERFMRAGIEAVADYELLELVLFRAIPRQDVKPLAKSLLSTFGDVNHVLSAPPERLKEISGVGDAVVREFKIVVAAAHRLAQAKVLGAEVLSNWEGLLTYCRTAMAHGDIEEFRILYLDRKNRLIADEKQGRGTVDHVPVYPREVCKRALDLRASALILVHNHPSGDPEPSAADITMTQRIADAADALGIVVHDHIIVGKGREMSFRSAGLL